MKIDVPSGEVLEIALYEVKRRLDWVYGNMRENQRKYGVARGRRKDHLAGIIKVQQNDIDWLHGLDNTIRGLMK